MGTPVPTPPPIGDNCSHCDSILWTPGATPLWVYCTFWEIIACVRAHFIAPNWGFVLWQDSLLPCQFDYADDSYAVRWTVSATHSYLTCKEVVSPYYSFFVDTISAACQLNFVNELVSCAPPMNAGRLGTAEIVLP